MLTALSNEGYYILSPEQWCSDLPALARLSSPWPCNSASPWGVVERVLSREVGDAASGSAVFQSWELDASGECVADFGGNQRMQLMHPTWPSSNRSPASDWDGLPAAEVYALHRIDDVHGRVQDWLRELFPERLGLSYMHNPLRIGVLAQPQVAHPDLPFNQSEMHELSQVSTIAAGEHPTSLWVLPESQKSMTHFWVGQLHGNEGAMQGALTAVSNVDPVEVHIPPNCRVIFHKHLLHGGPAYGRARTHEYWGGACTTQPHPNLRDVAVPLMCIDPRLADAVKPFGSHFSG